MNIVDNKDTKTAPIDVTLASSEHLHFQSQQQKDQKKLNMFKVNNKTQIKMLAGFIVNFELIQHIIQYPN